MRHRAVVAAALLSIGGVFALCASARRVEAQTAQPLSIQISGLYQAMVGEETGLGLKNGPGAEAQLRWTRGAGSIGVGFDFTTHGSKNTEPGEKFDFKFYGAFVEPRYVFELSSSTFAPYLSARVGAATGRADFVFPATATDPEFSGTFTMTGFTMNAGGGFLVRLNARSNIDLGATYGYKKFTEAKFEGETLDLEDFSTRDVILRVGISFGIGK